MWAKRSFGQLRQTTRIEADVSPIPGAEASGTATNPVLPHTAAFGDGVWMGPSIEIGNGHEFSLMSQPRQKGWN